ncbi:MAG: hypothetical protein J0L86_14890 [Flavobacteriales bacterium]|nr:hypothetical protein [Flavobacteriales bacterium]
MVHCAFLVLFVVNSELQYKITSNHHGQHHIQKPHQSTYKNNNPFIHA